MEVMDAVGRVELGSAADDWQLALDHAAVALDAAVAVLPPRELTERRRALAHERVETAAALAGLAAEEHLPYVPWLSPTPVGPASLGLPDDVEACLFDLDGVVSDSGALHAAAWAEVLDDVLLLRADGRQPFVP